jgi:hypothetical protein
MQISIALEIIDDIKKEISQFDSHYFIREFIKKYPVMYGELLIKHKSVKTAHSEISRFLSNNAASLKIERIGNIESRTILDTIEECANWKII